MFIKTEVVSEKHGIIKMLRSPIQIFQCCLICFLIYIISYEYCDKKQISSNSFVKTEESSEQIVSYNVPGRYWRHLYRAFATYIHKCRNFYA